MGRKDVDEMVNISGEIVLILLAVVVVDAVVVVVEVDTGNRVAIRMISQRRDNRQLDASVLRQGPDPFCSATSMPGIWL